MLTQAMVIAAFTAARSALSGSQVTIRVGTASAVGVRVPARTVAALTTMGEEGGEFGGARMLASELPAPDSGVTITAGTRQAVVTQPPAMDEHEATYMLLYRFTKPHEVPGA